MSAELISIVALVAMFVIATVLPINIGVLAFVGAFFVGTFVAGLTADEIVAGFPGDLFVLLVGVTYLFAIAQNNGTIDWLVRAAVRVVSGQHRLQHRARGAHLRGPRRPEAPWPAGCGGGSRWRRTRAHRGRVGRRGAAPAADVESASGAQEPGRVTLQQQLTIVGLVGLAVAAFVFDLDVGFVALTVAALLALVSPQAQKKAVGQVSWSVVLLIGGVLTYVSVLQEIGTIDYVANAVAGIGAPLIAALLLFYIGAVVSAFASSTALLSALIPLAVPFLLGGELGAVGVIAALAVSSTVVDCSPFSTNGAIILAESVDVDKDAFYRRLLAYGAAVVVVAPVVTWVTLVVPGWL